jgi:hypothetical protein
MERWVQEIRRCIEQVKGDVPQDRALEPRNIASTLE